MRWNQRLGLPSSVIVKQVVNKGNLLLSDSQVSESVCEACQCAKSHQLPYPKSTSVSHAPLELVFSDVWGHARDSFGRKKYYVSFIDDTTSLLGFICLSTNLKFSLFFKNSKNLLRDILIEKS